MSGVTIKVNPNILQWAVEQAPFGTLDEKLMGKIKKWISGEKLPTFNQVETLSKKTNIPFGYFFLDEPPKEELSILEFRTIDNDLIEKPSRELIDTIGKMKEIQEWMREYRIDRGFGQIDVVGSIRKEQDVIAISDKIRRDLSLENGWFFDSENMKSSFKIIRSKLEAIGIIVMMNGIVGNNTRRALNPSEFRGFVLIDDIAPVIFINARDSDGAKLFTIVHELVHVWLGLSDFYNTHDYLYNKDSEVFCNKVTAEFLLPLTQFKRYWSEVKAVYPERVTKLAKQFNVGVVTVARRALDERLITTKEYDLIVNKQIEMYQLQQKKKSTGGDYYSTMGTRLDRNLVNAVNDYVNAGKMTYTEAYRLTNTSRNTFDKVVEQFGGIWR